MLLDDCITHHARYRRDKAALVWDDGSWSYGELGERVARCAALFAARGVSRGDRVALLSDNSPWFLVVLFATARVGGIFVPLNYRLSVPELVENIADCGARLLVVQPAYLDRLRQGADGGPDCDVVALGASPHATALEELVAASPAAPIASEVTGDDPVMLQYTSGTTGKSKGVLSKHSAWVQSCLIQAPLKRMLADSVFLGVLPMCYTGGLKASLEVMYAGATMVLRTRFDADDALDRIERHGVTNVYVVPTMFYALLDAQAARPRDLATLSWVNCGGAPLLEHRLHQAAALFDCHLTQGYGMTELAGGSLSFAGPEDHIHNGAISPKLASVGRPLIDCQVKLVDDAGDEVPVGTPGEVLVKTERALLGYWGQPADATPIDAQGYYHTGDVARCDEDGYLYIVDRKKDMIISGGLNIYSKEVEDALAGHAAVQEAYVVGLPDERWGERVHAFVILDHGARADASELEQWCRERIGAYKCPRSIAFVARDSLPVNWGGKVQKRTLRDDYLRGSAAASS